jgi:thiamine-monophosphate kinase
MQGPVTMRVSQIGEFGLIVRLRRFQNLTDRVIRGIGDDAAVLKYNAQRYQLLTTDMLVEGVHFLRSMPAEKVGRKALACSLSDIAAMGGIPTFAVVSLGIPKTTNVRYIEKMYAGMLRLARAFGVSLVGGDTVRSAKITINVALLGEVERTRLVRRDGARVNDVIFVSGPLGGSLKSGRHLTFTPRIKEARFLAEHFKPRAMMDISDGLKGDLGHILKASGVGAVLMKDAIPVNRGATLRQALTEGEDFELLFTLAKPVARKLLSRFPKKFYAVGEIVSRKSGLKLMDSDGKAVPFNLRSFAHF